MATPGIPTDQLTFDFPADITSPQPFTIAVNPSFIADTLEKVRRWRPTRALTSDWNNEGPAATEINALAACWSTDYSWAKIQERMNTTFSHFATSVPKALAYEHPIPLHFVHERSKNDQALPLLLLHGWPSTHLEWIQVIGHLTGASPAASQSTSYHVVAPDLPGFGFSPAPTHAGMGPREMSTAMDALMQQLGYAKYGIVSTDLGWFVGSWMANDFPERVVGHFTDFFLTPPTPDDLDRFYKHRTTPEENNFIRGAKAKQTSHFAYATLHSQKPLAVAYALSDSPVGFAAWIWDLLHTIGDGYAYSYEHIITTAMMLYIPGVYGNVRTYLQFAKDGFKFPKSATPTGVSIWDNPNGPDPEMVYHASPPRSWTERASNVVFFKRHEFGGHFPAESQSELWVADVREFFALVQKGIS